MNQRREQMENLAKSSSHQTIATERNLARFVMSLEMVDSQEI